MDSTIEGLYIQIDSLLAANWVSTLGREPKSSENYDSLPVHPELRPPMSQLGRREPWPLWKLLFLWGRDCTGRPWPCCPGKALLLSCLPRAVCVVVVFLNGPVHQGSWSPKMTLDFWRLLCFWAGNHCGEVFCVHGGCCSWSLDQPHYLHPGAWWSHLACCDTVD